MLSVIKLFLIATLDKMAVVIRTIQTFYPYPPASSLPYAFTLILLAIKLLLDVCELYICVPFCSLLICPFVTCSAQEILPAYLLCLACKKYLASVIEELINEGGVSMYVLCVSVSPLSRCPLISFLDSVSVENYILY